MFQYAFARHVAHLNNVPLFLDLAGFEVYKARCFSLQHFALKAKVAKNWEVAKVLGTSSRYSKLAFWRSCRIGMPSGNSKFKKIIDDGFSFNAKFLQERGFIYISGYWQNLLYFNSVHEIIRKDFDFVTTASSQNQEMARFISGCNAVSLHVRRGDYLESPIHGCCDLAYYRKAASIISNSQSDPCFFIFSDDILWVRNNLQLYEKHVFVDINNDSNKSYEDLRLMSLCRHHIIANSTFSWWGAWLGAQEGITIAPARWMSDPSNGPSSETLLPSHWLKI